MAALLSEQLQPNSQGLYTEFWCEDVKIVSDDILQRVAQLYTQLKVQQKFQTVSNLLRNNSNKKTLPNQTAIRVKFFLQLVFSEDKLGKELKKVLTTTHYCYVDFPTQLNNYEACHLWN
jgi:beta-galactosidase beta subunit